MYTFYDSIEKLIEALPREAQESFLEAGKLLSIKKGDFLLKIGEICHHLYVIKNGVFRTYRNLLKDDIIIEVTSGFSFPGDFDTSPSSLILKIPSYESIQAITKAEVFAIDFSKLDNLQNTYPAFNKLIFNALIDYSTAIETVLYDFRVLSARERYQKLLNENPDYISQIPLKYLASFLNMKEETLSRIRKP